MQAASKTRWWITPVILAGCIVLLHLFALHTAWVERIYSTGIYHPVSAALRIITGWLPFSLGDVLYLAAILWLVYKFLEFFRHRPSWKKFFVAMRNLAVKILWLYLVFLFFWGLNYYRYGIGYQLHLAPDMYDTEDLKTVTSQLILKLNESRRQMDSLDNAPNDKAIFTEAITAYAAAKKTYPYLQYNHAAVKKMLSGTVGNYGGFLGYYNPFTGGAQVDTRMPSFLIPFTACHEIAHQIGYASESEASFVGYLAVKADNSPAFAYSTYFGLFAYANSELFERDSTAARQNNRLLDTLVRRDIRVYREFLQAYENPVEPLLSRLYGNYLKAHNQPQGIESYDEVVAWIISYYKKYGVI